MNRNPLKAVFGGDILPVLILLICVLIQAPHAFGLDGPDHQSTLSMPDSSSLLSNLWKEDRQAVRKPEDPSTLYPLERHCKAAEVSEPQEAFQHDDTSWSTLFSRYTLDAGDELDTWLVNQEVHKDTQHEKHIENHFDILIPLLFPVAFAIFLCICVVIIPLLGALAFRFLQIFWYLATHQVIKRSGRWILITTEKIRRSRQKMLLPDGVKKPPKSQFHLPVFFRLHSGEDVPDELEESDDDDVWLTRGQNSDDDDDDDDQHRKFKVGASLSGLQINEINEEGQGEV